METTKSTPPPEVPSPANSETALPARTGGGPPITGVYLIWCEADEKLYAGVSFGKYGIFARWRWHQAQLSYGIHDNSHLQAAWNKYGSATFYWIVYELISLRSEALQLERKLIEQYGLADGARGFNLTAGGDGVAGTPEVREKQSRKGKLARERARKKKALEDPIPTGSKRCRKCKRILPLAAFRNHATNFDRKESICPECFRKYRLENRRKKLPEPRRQLLERKDSLAPGFKICAKCLQTKPAREFWKRKHSGDGLNHRCKSCCRIRKPRSERYAEARRAEGAPPGCKKCLSCAETKPLTEFNLRSCSFDGRHYYCKNCISKINKRQRKPNDESANKKRTSATSI